MFPMEIKVTGRIECRFSREEVTSIRESIRAPLNTPLGFNALRYAARAKLGIFAGHAHEKRIVSKQDGSAVIHYRMGE